MIRLAILMTAGLLCTLSAESGEQPPAGLAALEKKLHGTWYGEGPCDGGITFEADGTYQRTDHGPGGNNSAGTWSLRWNALPPTLSLVCKTSDDPDYAGQRLDWKIAELDDETLVFKDKTQSQASFSRRDK